jgi:hypothetical protein
MLGFVAVVAVAFLEVETGAFAGPFQVDIQRSSHVEVLEVVLVQTERAEIEAWAGVHVEPVFHLAIAERNDPSQVDILMYSHTEESAAQRVLKIVVEEPTQPGVIVG